MIIDITQTTKIGRVYRAGSEPLKVENVTRYSKRVIEYTTISFSCDVHNMGTHIDVMNPDVVIENERLIGEGIKFDVSHIPNKVIKLKDLDLSLVKEGIYVFFQTNWDQYFEDEEKFNEFLNKCNKLSLYDTNIQPEYKSSLITLSTCEYSNKNGRLVVVAYKLDS